MDATGRMEHHTSRLTSNLLHRGSRRIIIVVPGLRCHLSFLGRDTCGANLSCVRHVQL